MKASGRKTTPSAKLKSCLATVLLLLALSLPASVSAATIIQFKAASFEGREASGGGHLTLICTPPPTNRITVLLKAVGGSAEAADLRWVSGSAVDRASWQAGWPVELLTGNPETEVGFGIVGDGTPEPDETLHLTLTVLAGDAVVGAQSNAVFTIRNGHPRIWLDERPTAAEGTQVRCQFYRYGDTNVVLSVGYATADDTARAGVDYVAATGLVTFAAGQLEAEIGVATLDNGRVDGDRAFLLNFSTTAPDVELVSKNALAVIVDNEQPVVWDRSFAPRPVSALATFALSPDGKLVVTEEVWPSSFFNGVRVVRWNLDGTPDTGFTTAQFTAREGVVYVRDLVLDPAGRCYVGGQFDAVNGQPRNGLARLLPNGALDESFQLPSDLVRLYGGTDDLDVQPDGRILCLRNLNQGVQRLFRLKADGSLDDAFRPDAVTRKARRVWAVADNQALVDVSEFGNPVPERPLARLASGGGLDPRFHRAELTGRDDSSVVIMDLVQQPDGKLLVAGKFASVDGQPRPNLVRLNADGSVDAGFAPPADAGLDDSSQISSIAVDMQGRVLVAGPIRRFNGQRADLNLAPQRVLLRLKQDGTPDETFKPVSDDVFKQLAPGIFDSPFIGGEGLRVFPQTDGKVLAWGYFLTKGWFFPGPMPGAYFLARIYDEPPATSVELTTARLIAAPDADQATVTVRRLGDSNGPAAVNYATRDGSAVAGRDYAAASGSLSFAPLEVVKSFAVPLLDPGQRREDRVLSVTLDTATGVEGISGPVARLVLAAPFGFRGIAGLPSDPRLTIFGSVGSTYRLLYHTPPEHPSDPWFWSGAPTEITLTNEVQTITDDPSWLDAWHNAQPVRFYRLRRLAP